MKIPIERVLEAVASKVTPTRHERDLMSKVSLKLRNDVDRILSEAGFKSEVSIQGSVARDTWLHGEGDLDIFASFSPNIDRDQWDKKVLPTLRKGLAQYPILERYAEHPYLEFSVDSVKVNVVPCYAVERAKWKSATDRTPYHTEYMLQHLTGDLKLETRILKRFMKGVGVYGAEIRVGGFSGMLVETLTLRYGSFRKTLEKSAEWRSRTVIEVEPSGRLESKLREKFASPLVVVDPVDPNRNLAAAVRTDKLWEFVAVGRQFQSDPSLSYFYPPPPKPKTRRQLLRRLKQSKSKIIVAVFPHSHVIPDVLWGQLLSLEKSLVNLVERHQFRVLHSGVWGDAERISAILLAVENAQLPMSQLHVGPPVEKKEESKAFLNRHVNSTDTISGPWIWRERWMVEKKRVFSDLSRLVVAAARNRKMGLAVPAELESGFRNRIRILQNEESLSIHLLPGFAQTLWRFMDGKPAWLKIQNS